MSRDHAFRIAHRGQVDAGIPAQQKIEVGRDLSQLRAGERSGRPGWRLDERREQLGDAGGVHAGKFQVSRFKFQ